MGACGCLFVVSLPPVGARQRPRVSPRCRDTTSQPWAQLGPLSTRDGPSAPGRRGASSSAACRAGRARSLPSVPPARLCPLRPGSPAPLRPAPSVCSAAAAAGTDTVSAGRESAETPVSNMGKVGRESERRCPAPPRAPSPPAGCNPAVQPAGSPCRKIAFRFYTFGRTTPLDPLLTSCFFSIESVPGDGGWGAPTDRGLPTAPGPAIHPGAPTDPLRAGGRGCGAGQGRERGRGCRRCGSGCVRGLHDFIVGWRGPAKSCYASLRCVAFSCHFFHNKRGSEAGPFFF